MRDFLGMIVLNKPRIRLSSNELIPVPCRHTIQTACSHALNRGGVTYPRDFPRGPSHLSPSPPRRTPGRPEGAFVLNILILLIGILFGAGLFAWRFVLLRDRHPNTDLYLRAVRALEGPPESGGRARP